MQLSPIGRPVGAGSVRRHWLATSMPLGSAWPRWPATSLERGVAWSRTPRAFKARGRARPQKAGAIGVTNGQGLGSRGHGRRRDRRHPHRPPGRPAGRAAPASHRVTTTRRRQSHHRPRRPSRPLGRAAQAGVEINVLVDVDLGMRRCRSRFARRHPPFWQPGSPIPQAPVRRRNGLWGIPPHPDLDAKRAAVAVDRAILNCETRRKPLRRPD